MIEIFNLFDFQGAEISFLKKQLNWYFVKNLPA